MAGVLPFKLAGIVCDGQPIKGNFLNTCQIFKELFFCCVTIIHQFTNKATLIKEPSGVRINGRFEKQPLLALLGVVILAEAVGFEPTEEI